MEIEFKRSELMKFKGELTLSLHLFEVKYSKDNASTLNTMLAEIITKNIEGDEDENTKT
jgi:hypothetical protein